MAGAPSGWAAPWECRAAQSRQVHLEKAQGPSWGAAQAAHGLTMLAHVQSAAPLPHPSDRVRAVRQHGQSALLSSAPAQPLRLPKVRLAALGSSALPGRGPATEGAATASTARARRLQSRRFHRVSLTLQVRRARQQRLRRRPLASYQCRCGQAARRGDETARPIHRPYPGTTVCMAHVHREVGRAIACRAARTLPSCTDAG